MPADCTPLLDPRATKTRAVIFGALRNKHAKAAEAMGINGSTFSEWFNAYADRIAILLTVGDLKPVPTGARCVGPAQFEFMKESTIDRLQRDGGPDTALNWDTHA